MMKATVLVIARKIKNVFRVGGSKTKKNVQKIGGDAHSSMAGGLIDKVEEERLLAADSSALFIFLNTLHPNAISKDLLFRLAGRLKAWDDMVFLSLMRHLFLKTVISNKKFLDKKLAWRIDQRFTRAIHSFAKTEHRYQSTVGTFESLIELFSSRKLEPATIIDVGYANGTPGLDTAFPEAHYHAFEPVPECEFWLEKLKGIRKRCTTYQVALSDQDGEAIFRVLPNFTNSKLEAIAKKNSAEGITVPVKKRRLDKLLKKNDLVGPVLLKIDTEGGDFDVLIGSEKILKNIDIIIIELKALGNFGHNNFPTAYDFLLKHDFQFYRQINPNVRSDQFMSRADYVFLSKSFVGKLHGAGSTLEKFLTKEKNKSKIVTVKNKSTKALKKL